MKTDLATLKSSCSDQILGLTSGITEFGGITGLVTDGLKPSYSDQILGLTSGITEFGGITAGH